MREDLIEKLPELGWRVLLAETFALLTRPVGERGRQLGLQIQIEEGDWAVYFAHGDGRIDWSVLSGDGTLPDDALLATLVLLTERADKTAADEKENTDGPAASAEAGE